jgi:O-antigen/teichoic acid export membrane protein
MGAVVSYIIILDFGLNNAIIRFVSKYIAEGDKEGEQNFLSMSMLLYGVISLLVIVLGIGLFFSLDTLFGNSLTAAELKKARIMFALLVFNMAMMIPGGAFFAICSAYERFVFPRLVKILRYLIRSLLVVGLLLLGGDAIGLVVLDTLTNLFMIALNAYYVFKKLKVSFKLRFVENALVKKIFSYSIWIFLFTVVQQFQLRGGQIVIGMKLDSVSVAIYAVGVLLGEFFSYFSMAISSVFLPRATQMMVSNASGKMLTSMMTRIGRFSLMVLFAILGAFALFGQQFIQLWVGSTYSQAWEITLLLMIAFTIPQTQSFANSLLEANNRFYYKAIVYLIFTLLGFTFGWFLVDYFGIVGVTYGIVAGWFIAIILVNIYYYQKLELNVLLFFKELQRDILPAFLFVMAIGFLIRQLPGEGWLNFICKNILFFVSYAVIMFFMGINGYEKKTILDLLKNGYIDIKKRIGGKFLNFSEADQRIE